MLYNALHAVDIREIKVNYRPITILLANVLTPLSDALQSIEGDASQRARLLGVNFL
jgi:hypothetical protein